MSVQTQPPSERDKVITNINNSLATIGNLQTQMNGMSANLSMIIGNLSNTVQILQESIQFLISDGNKKDENIAGLKAMIEILKPKEEKTDNEDNIPPIE